jgi:glycerophosphoryl diester phosphodiesterase
MPLSPVQKHARLQSKKRDLERKVLAHVKKNGTCLYDVLSVRFDPNHTAEVQPVLRGLKEYGYIEVTKDKKVIITTFGLQQLESKTL